MPRDDRIRIRYADGSCRSLTPTQMLQFRSRVISPFAGLNCPTCGKSQAKRLCPVDFPKAVLAFLHVAVPRTRTIRVLMVDGGHTGIEIDLRREEPFPASGAEAPNAASKMDEVYKVNWSDL